MDEEKPRTNLITRAEKDVRGNICYLPTQWIWWAVLPCRWFISWLGGILFGDAVRKFLWRKILTPANFLTSARFWLLGKAVNAFIHNESPAYQANLLFLAIITDFFDGPLARNNDEVTELGTYMDHIGDWGIMVWVFFISFWFKTLPMPYLITAFVILPGLLLIYLSKFRVFYDRESGALINLAAFAAEELQTDFWGRLQFVFLAIALFGGLFTMVANDEDFLLRGLMAYVSDNAKASVIETCLALYLMLGGYSIRDGLDYSEVKIKRFREKLKKIKSGS